MRRFRSLILVAVWCSAAAAQAQVAPSNARAAASSKSTATGSAGVKATTGTGALNPAIAAKVETFLREYYAWGKDIQVEFVSAKDSIIPGFDEVRIRLTVNGGSQEGDLYISKDGKIVVQGSVNSVAEDPFAANRRILATGDSPSVGPKDAKVTVVEFSDFQCPHCRAFADNLKSMEAKYPQVRWVFKNYPLVKIHPWAMEAAIAARCAYLSSNDAFWKVSASIFGSQDTLTADNAAEQFRTAAIVAGVPADAYAACIANPATKAAIEGDIKQGQAVDVESTPTIFVNGRPAIGGEPQQVSGSIDYELAKTEAPGPSLH